jgi:hypothetical protein
MKFNVLQAMAKILTFASNITNPIIINPLEHMYITNHQCISVIVFFFPRVLKVGQDCHGACSWFCGR